MPPDPDPLPLRLPPFLLLLRKHSLLFSASSPKVATQAPDDRFKEVLGAGGGAGPQSAVDRPVLRGSRSTKNATYLTWQEKRTRT